MNQVTYEFVVETLDFYPGCGDDPDILDTVAFDSMEEAHTWALYCEDPWRICLRRDVGNENEGLVGREYAYPKEDGYLRSRFETYSGVYEGTIVPKKYLKIFFPRDSR